MQVAEHPAQVLRSGLLSLRRDVDELPEGDDAPVLLDGLSDTGQRDNGRKAVGRQPRRDLDRAACGAQVGAPRTDAGHNSGTREQVDRGGVSTELPGTGRIEADGPAGGVERTSGEGVGSHAPDDSARE